jgi:hypothetical protein
MSAVEPKAEIHHTQLDSRKRTYTRHGMLRFMPSEMRLPWPIAQALLVSRHLLDGGLGVFDGCIALDGYAHKVVPDWRVDPDFCISQSLRARPGIYHSETTASVVFERARAGRRGNPLVIRQLSRERP